MEEAGPVLLEPIDWVSVTVRPSPHGDVLGDLHARRARVQGTDTPQGNQIISALVPEAELTRYPVDLRSLTGGRGRVRSRRDHYDGEGLSRALRRRARRRGASATPPGATRGSPGPGPRS